MSILARALSGPRASASLPLFAGLLVADLAGSIWTVRRHELLSTALAWTVVCAVCWKLSSRVGRFTGSSSRRRPVRLAGCLLLAAVCERVAGYNRGWIKAIAPLAYYVLRELGIGQLGGSESPTAGRGRLIFVVASSAYVVTGAGIQHNHVSSLVLGGCSALFSALGYLLLEDSLPALAGAPPAPARRGVPEEFWSTCVLLGKEAGLYLALGSAAAAWALEDTVQHALRWQGRGFAAAALHTPATDWPAVLRIGGVGLLGAARWMLVPPVVAQLTAVGATFADLAGAMAGGLAAAVGAARAAMFVVAAWAMAWFYRSPAAAAKTAKEAPRPVRRTHSALLLLLSGLIAAAYVVASAPAPYVRPAGGLVAGSAAPPSPQHPVARRIQEAAAAHAARVARQSQTLGEAVRAYQQRYGLAPPPNFDRWFEFARERRVALVDDGYDAIFHALQPFWGLAPGEIRRRAREAMGFRDDYMLRNNKLLHAYIRGGAVRTGGQGPAWQKTATEGMLRAFAEFLPDMDLAFNIHDEPRVVVPHDRLSQYVQRAQARLAALDATRATNRFSPLPAEERQPLVNFSTTPFNVFAHQSVWSHAILSCPPSAPVRSIDALPDARERFSEAPLGLLTNVSAAADVCLSPSLQRRHGFFDRPNAFNVAQDLYPVFSQSKMSTFADILYPSPWYWAGRVTYEPEQDQPWERKAGALYWRGSTTGGFSRNGGWRRQHRQHVVAALNANDSATVLQRGEAGWAPATVPRQSLAELFDVHFSHVGQCDAPDCAEQKAAFPLAPKAEQQEAWGSKYLLDVDGNAFSGRFYAFLRSTSAVVKTAVFREWHDEWIAPWVHYLPLSMELEEAGEMVRWLGKEPEGEEAARKIAEEGKRWAEAGLRNEDMEAWFFRLLLEYARVIDDNRDTIGYVG